MPELTSIQIDFDIRDKLRELSEQDMRSMAAEVRWLVMAEWSKRQTLIIPTPTTSKTEA